MTDLEKLDIVNIQSIVNPYKNLLYHRTVILERIRKIAFRNMIHFTEASEYCQNRNEGEVTIEDIQSKMLNDQGLENNETNRTGIEYATVYPLQLYLALFYAEIESFEKLKKTHNIYRDDELDSYLKTNKQWVDRLKKFRDSFLHPNKDSLSAERQFLQVKPSHNLAPILQCKFDGYLQRLQDKLSNYLSNTLNCLPEIQKLYCLYSFLTVKMEQMKLDHNLSGMKWCVDQLPELKRKIKILPENIQSWLPNQTQIKIAYCIAECMNELDQALPKVHFIPQYLTGETSIIIDGQSTELVEKQTAMRHHIIAMLISGRQISNFLGSREHATHLKENIGGYMRILMTSVVLWNEFLYERNSVNMSLLEKNKQYPLISKEELSCICKDIPNSFSLQDCDEWIAPYRVNIALFYELLRIYYAVSKEDPSLANRKLDTFTSSKEMRKLKMHRNAIFHVSNSRKTPVDLMSTTSGALSIYSKLIKGISEFFGV